MLLSQQVLREYVVKNSYFFKLTRRWQCPSMTEGEEHLRYRIESNSQHSRRNLKILEYPSKKDVGRLKHRTSSYEHTIGTVFGFWTLKQIDGWKEPFEETFSSLAVQLIFSLDGDADFTMKTDFGSLTTKLLDENERLLAQFRLRFSSFVSRRVYDMKVFTNKYPDQFFCLALAAQQYVATNNKGKWKLFVTINYADK